MTTLEIIETTFKALHKRTDDAFETVEGINKQHAKTTSGMNNVVDTIREMREKVRNLMSLQDDIAHQFKNVDKLVMGNVPGDFEPVKRVKKETKRSSFDDDMDYKPASKVKFDASSDEEDFTPEEPAKEERAEHEERAAALEEAKKLDAEFEADEAALEAGNDAPTEEIDEEAEARRIAELELDRLAEEENRLAEEEKRLAEEELKRLEEEEELKRLEEEEELKKLQEEDAALKAEEEELRRLEEEEAIEEEAAKKAAEEEAKKKAPPKGKPGKFQFGNQLKSGGNKNKVVFK